MSSQRAEVLIIGAGIVGGSIAWRLAQTGITTALLDSGTLGGEASWAGAGMLAPGGEFVTRSQWSEFALESRRLYPAFVRELEAESTGRIDYRECGALDVAQSDEEWQELLARRAVQQELGILSEKRDDGLFYPDDALVDPRDVTRALKFALQRRNVPISEGTCVIGIGAIQDGVQVETTGGVLTASVAVLAAGAWSGQIRIHGFEIPASFPVRGHLLGYALPPGSMGSILRQGHTYVMQRSSGFTIAGTSSEQVGFDRRLDPGIIADIRARACELAPELRSAPEPQAWIGFRPATENYEPVIGRLEDTRVWLAYGHYRNGILLAPATAARVAAEIKSSLETGSSAPRAQR